VETVHEARWWRADPDRPGGVACELCPRGCRLGEGQKGFCGARRNHDGRLRALTYGHPSSVGIDPIEKKPLFHFQPGTQVLSFGTVGCTLACRFCQNWTLSRGDADAQRSRFVSPQEIVELAEREGSPAIAYTYNEPTVFAEYMVACCELARERGIRNVAVTNGYIAPAARSEVFARLDAANVDLKGFSEEFYADQAQAHLAPVLDTLRWIVHETRIWLEITTLLIPGLNDADEMLAAECDWIRTELGPEVPFHLTAFHPAHQMKDRPRTPADTLTRARRIALERGLRYVYVGNVEESDAQSTRCPSCGALLIRRSWHATHVEGLDGGRCRACSAAIAGVFA
jgi:pyruvate formate lyase activating enzyme